jgi:hypothetical protein
MTSAFMPSTIDSSSAPSNVRRKHSTPSDAGDSSSIEADARTRSSACCAKSIAVSTARRKASRPKYCTDIQILSARHMRVSCMP